MSLVFVDSFNLSDGPNFGFCLNCGKQYERNPLVEAKRLCPGCYKNEANNTIMLRCRTCTRTDIKRLEVNGQCPDCFFAEIGWQRSPGLQEKSVFGNCSVCMVAFTRVSAKVEIDGVEYCFPCWDELKRTGRVDLTRRPVAPELFPQPVNMPPLVEMRPKRQIQLED